MVALKRHLALFEQKCMQNQLMGKNETVLHFLKFYLQIELVESIFVLFIVFLALLVARRNERAGTAYFGF